MLFPRLQNVPGSALCLLPNCGQIPIQDRVCTVMSPDNLKIYISQRMLNTMWDAYPKDAQLTIHTQHVTRTLRRAAWHTAYARWSLIFRQVEILSLIHRRSKVDVIHIKSLSQIPGHVGLVTNKWLTFWCQSSAHASLLRVSLAECPRYIMQQAIVLAMTRIALHHHGSGLEDRHGDLCHRQLLMVRLLCRNHWSVGCEHEVDSWAVGRQNFVDSNLSAQHT